ncbi:MAG TPA: DinB family protein [Thermoanaerobaculia bacterium]
MTTLEFFRRQFRSERPKFLAVLRAMPEGKLGYRPHEGNSTAGMIAWFLVLELRALVDMVRTGESHWTQPPAPESPAAIAEEYDRSAAEMEGALTTLTEEQWGGDARMYIGDRLFKTAPLGETILDFFLDAVHHRGQLTTYLRPMGGKVPSIYGPSGDSV